MSEADELYEMVNIYPADSGLPMTVWAGPRGNARHDVRVKVNMAHGNQIGRAPRRGRPVVWSPNAMPRSG
jgi:hypothetical protein